MIIRILEWNISCDQLKGVTSVGLLLLSFYNKFENTYYQFMLK